MRKTLKQKVDDSLLEMQQAQKQYEQILAQFNAQEEKVRNKRIAERGIIIEKALPEVVALSKKQFDVFLEKVMLTPHARRIIAELSAEVEASAVSTNGNVVGQNSGTIAYKTAETAAQPSAAPMQKPAGTTTQPNTPMQKPTGTSAQPNAAPALKPAGAAHHGANNNNAHGGNNAGRQSNPGER